MAPAGSSRKWNGNPPAPLFSIPLKSSPVLISFFPQIQSLVLSSYQNFSKSLIKMRSWLFSGLFILSSPPVRMQIISCCPHPAGSCAHYQGALVFSLFHKRKKMSCWGLMEWLLSHRQLKYFVTANSLAIPRKDKCSSLHFDEKSRSRNYVQFDLIVVFFVLLIFIFRMFSKHFHPRQGWHWL